MNEYSEIVEFDDNEQTGNNVSEVAKRIVLKRGEFEAEIKNLPSTVVSALYHEITGKKEKISQSFSGRKIITYADLNDLASRLSQNTEKYHPVTKDMSVLLFLNDGRKYRLSSWFKFKQFDFRTNARTHSMSIEYSFVLKSPTGSHHHYTLSVEAGSLLGMPKHFDKKIADELTERLRDSHIFDFEIEYVDTLVARDFYDVVRVWYENLKDNEAAFYYPRMRELVNVIRPAVGLLEVISIVAVFVIAYLKSRDKTGLGEFAYPYVVAFSLMIVTVWVFTVFTNALWTSIDKINSFTVVKLTSGDDEAIAIHDVRNKCLAIRAALAFCALLFTLSVNVLSNYIYDYVK